MQPDLRVRIGSMELKNPVTVASGTYGYGTEYRSFYNPERLGAMFLKGVTLEARPGNAPQRLVETPSGLMNAIGLQNVGIDEFIDHKVPPLEGMQTRCIANICGSSPEQYLRLVEQLNEIQRIDAFELNFSCPNVKEGCLTIGSDPGQTEHLTRQAVARTARPVIVKLSPNVRSMAQTAQAAEAGGAAAVSVMNTFLALSIDVQTRRPRLGNVTGGLSGPAIRPIAVRMVWEAAQAVGIPVIGQGGIMTAEHALEFMIAGASAVSIGTANFVDPMAPMEVIEGITAYLVRHGIGSVRELVGSLELPAD